MVTVLAVATMISLTKSGAKSPWALTPGVESKRSASSRGLSTTPW